MSGGLDLEPGITLKWPVIFQVHDSQQAESTQDKCKSVNSNNYSYITPLWDVCIFTVLPFKCSVSLFLPM